MKSEDPEVQKRDQYVSLVAHEFRTPLTALGTRLELLRGMASKLDGLNPTDREALITSFGSCRDEVGRLARLIEALHSFSQLRAGKQELKRSATDLVYVVRSAIGLLAQENKGAPSVKLIHRGPVFGMWDADQIEQLALNLVSNAFKYGRGRPVEISAMAEGTSSAILTVIDQGDGIPEECREHVFDAFDRGNQTGATQGLGLGLFICRHIVEAHGGTIVIDEDTLSGTKLIVTLPLRY